MDISLHDAAEFMRNSEITKENITTSNLTVLDNVMLNIDAVNYKTGQIFTSATQQYPPVDLSSSDFQTSVSEDSQIITTQVSNQSYGDGLYKFMSSETVNIPDHSSISFNVFSDTNIWNSELSNGGTDGEYYVGDYKGIHSLDPADAFKGLWFSLELPREIVLKSLEFKRTNSGETSFYIKVYIQDLNLDYVLIREQWVLTGTNSYTMTFAANLKKSNKYWVIFQRADWTSQTYYLQINSLKLFGYEQTNITSFQDILETKQNKLETGYGLDIVNNNIGFGDNFLRTKFEFYDSNNHFNVNELPYKELEGGGNWAYHRIFDVSIVDTISTNLIYSYVVKVATNDTNNNFLIHTTPIFSYFPTSTVSVITDSSIENLNFGDWATLQFEKVGTEHRCSIIIYNDCRVNIVSR